MAAMVAMLILVAQDAGPPRECRESSYTTADGRQGSMRYCKDAEGVWRRVAGVALPQPPFPARAEVSFRGTYQLKIKTPGRPVRRLDLNSLLNSGGQTQLLEGAITIAARFDGPAAYATVSGTGGIAAVRLSGLVRDGHCRLVDDRQTMLYEGRCGRDGFKGTITGQATAQRKFTGSFDTTVAQVRNLDER